MQHNRPPVDKRRFTNDQVEEYISAISSKLKDKELALLFENCYPNTLDTTIYHHVAGKSNNISVTLLDEVPYDSFVITGDIPAMWLRDSTNQILPYIHFTKNVPAMRKLVLGVIQRQATQIIRDPYANAFKMNEDQEGPSGDVVKPEPSRIVWESKYELDSLAAFLKLSFGYFHATSKDTGFYNDTWVQAVKAVIQLVQIQQKGTLEEEETAYKFQRSTNTQTETLMMGGRTAPAKRCGLVKSAFRPSDDACTLPFLIPSNCMMAVELDHLESILSHVGQEPVLSATAKSLSVEIRQAILKHGIVQHPVYGSIYAFEVDGYGSAYCMDDANVPSLLSLPYLGFTTKDDPIYVQTRRFVLSDSNPYYFSGSAGEGIGGPHVGLDYIWPMSIIIRALTSQHDQEILDCLATLKSTTANTGFMHESFHKNNAAKYTRPWFAWANALFGELIIHLVQNKPHLVE